MECDSMHSVVERASRHKKCSSRLFIFGDLQEKSLRISLSSLERFSDSIAILQVPEKGEGIENFSVTGTWGVLSRVVTNTNLNNYILEDFNDTNDSPSCRPSSILVSDADCRRDLGSNPGEDMDVCKCIVPSRHGCTLNSRQASSPFVRWVEERSEAPDHPQRVLPLNWGETELNGSVPCVLLKAMADDRRHLTLYHDEFRGP
ncbi:cullin-4A [Trichonephila clavipes]|nr:cullin-4A [Trichonephila clavipes]